VETEPVASREDVEQAAATWIARRDSDAWTAADAASLQQWLAESAGHRAAYYRLNSAWSEAGRVRALGGPMQAQYAESAAPLDAPPMSAGRTRRVALFAVAASVLILLAGTLAVFRDELFNTHSFTTVVGGLQTIPLADGSRVTLNTDTELRILLNDRERSVEIGRGEAFFEVAHDAKRPFVVKVGERRVIAVGTQFSVRREGADVRVVVSEGTVRYEAHANDASAPTLLPAGSIARAEGDAIQVQELPVTEAERTLTWRNGLLTFRNTPLADAVAEFNRYNTRKIVIEDPKIASLEVGGVFRSRNVEPFVHLLERGFAVRAAVEPDRIVLTASPRRDSAVP
jgi:transmembrane sensor